MTLPNERILLDEAIEARPDDPIWEPLIKVMHQMVHDPDMAAKTREGAAFLLRSAKSGLASKIEINSNFRFAMSAYSALKTPAFLPRPELFLISYDTLVAMAEDDINSTYADMVKMDIARLPYSTMDIGIPAKVILRLSDETPTDFAGWDLRFRYHNNEFLIAILITPSGEPFDLHMLVLNESTREVANNLYKTLVVLLATRNAVKTRVKDKMLAAGVKSAKKNRFRPLYTTTISLPRSLPTEVSGPGAAKPGYSLRPHLRRGHIRRQHYGPKLQFTKQIWIEPCFVNADEDFVSSRTAYNTSITLANLPTEQPNDPT